MSKSSTNQRTRIADLSTVGHELPDEHLRLAVGSRRMGPGGGSFETVLTYDYDRKICVPDYIPFD